MGVYINGIGAISEAACIAEEFSALADGREYLAKGQMTEFASAVPASKLRRAGRYSKLTVSAAAFALKDSETEFTDPYRTGAVGYGAAEYNIQFSDQVQGGDPQLCSPSVFSQSVANSCLGQLCMIKGIKGESTMLRGGDPLEYASLLLETDRADIMLCGETEESRQRSGRKNLKLHLMQKRLQAVLLSPKVLHLQFSVLKKTAAPTVR